MKSNLWLASYIYSQELNRPTRFGNPSYKSSTHLWSYKLKKSSREEELNRVLVESANLIKDEATQHDRSPLEAQREWRHEAENNVLDLLERDGLLAPQGDVDKLLNTVVNNLEVTNNVDEQIVLRCRVLGENFSGQAKEAAPAKERLEAYRYRIRRRGPSLRALPVLT